MMRRALLIGIDEYPASPLAGCVNDAQAMARLLGRNEDGSTNFDCQLLTAPHATITRAVLRKKIDELLRDKADVALFYFAGHGTENNLGGYLVTPDTKQYDEGVSLVDVLTQANNSHVGEVVIILDSCFSGALGAVPALGRANDQAILREGVSILTASRSTQTSAEVDGRGLFTSLVCSALDGGAADTMGKVTVASVYAYVDEALGSWQQRPLFKSHVARLLSLRQCRPAVELDTLRTFPHWFPAAAAEFPLDPSFEPYPNGAPRASGEPRNLEHEAVFAQLQRCRAARLVEPVGELHMYDAAMQSKSCRLTPLGKHYWELANEGRL